MSAIAKDILPIIRMMTDRDVERVAEIELTAYAFPWSAGIFRDCLRVGYCCRVMVSPDGVTGYGIMSTGAGEAHILNICVTQSMRGNGHGRRMLDYLLGLAESAGVYKVFLEVRPTNRTARRLYRDAGFVQVGRRKDYYRGHDGREDALVLRLDL